MGIIRGLSVRIITENYERERERERERLKARRVNSGTRSFKKGRDSFRGKSSGIIHGLSMRIMTKYIITQKS